MSSKMSKEDTGSLVNTPIAGAIKTQPLNALEVAKQCQDTEKDLRVMLRDLTARLEHAFTLRARLDAQWQSRLAELEALHVYKDREEVSALQRELEYVQRDNASLKLTIQECEGALAIATHEHKAMSVLLAQRTSELDAMRALLPHSHSITDSEVVDLVKDLNYAITQAAISLVDSLENVPQDIVSPDHLESTVRLYRDRFGDGAAKMLLSPLPLEPQVRLQLGIQSLLAGWAQTCIHQWSFSDMVLEAALKRIEKAIFDCEPEHVAIYWRTLGRKYLRLMDQTRVTETALADSLAEYWADALLNAGYYLGKDIASTKLSVLQHAGEQLEGVSDLIFKLNVAVGENITRGRMQCFAADYGAPFHGNTMEAYYQDVYKQNSCVGNDDGVICTIELGLRREESGAAESLLLKPKVVALL